MKTFFKKLHHSPWGYKIPFYLTLILYFVSYGFFTVNLLQLVGIETIIRYIVLILFGIFGIIYLITSLVKIFERKKGLFIFLTVLAILFSIVFGVASFAIHKIYSKIDQITSSDTSTYTTVILTLKDTEFTDSSVIGMVTDEEDRTGYILPNEWIKKENIPNEIDYKSNTIELLNALYNKEIDAIFINKDYPVLYSGEERFANIVTETKIIKEYSKKMKTEESELLTTTKSLTEPFTVLVLGVDSESQNGLDANAAFNGDTLLLVTFNPKTLTATMLSIPRDMYVPIISASGYNRGYAKINSSSSGGTMSTINTIQNITGINIDYFVKVNFRGVVDLVETLGGVDVDVEPPDYQYYIHSWGEGRLCEQDSLRNFSNMICMNTGMQHLNGEQALAYARNRHGYLESDIARNRHQQQIIEAVAKKLVQTASLSDFEKLLDTISNNIATNMKTSQILSFYQSIKGMLINALSGEDFITIQKTQLTYYNLDVGGYSCLGYYQGSMDAITKAMRENLGLEQVKTIKSFAYDYSTDYEQTSEVIGKGIYSGSRLVSMPSFIGKSVSEAQSFASKYGKTMLIEYVNDPTQPTGIIVNQSVGVGALTIHFNSFTIYVNNPSETEDPDEEEESEDPEKDPDKENENDPEENNGGSSSGANTGSEGEETPTEPTVPGTPTTPEESDGGNTGDTGSTETTGSTGNSESNTENGN